MGWFNSVKTQFINKEWKRRPRSILHSLLSCKCTYFLTHNFLIRTSNPIELSDIKDSKGLISYFFGINYYFHRNVIFVDVLEATIHSKKYFMIPFSKSKIFLSHGLTHETSNVVRAAPWLWQMWYVRLVI